MYISCLNHCNHIINKLENTRSCSLYLNMVYRMMTARIARLPRRETNEKKFN